MRQKLRPAAIIVGTVILLAGSGLNGYYLNKAYASYRQQNSNLASLPKATVIPKTNITSAKAKSLEAGRTGQLADKGLYKYEELDHSKVNTSDSQGELVLANDTKYNANFVLAGSSSLNIPKDDLNDGWSTKLVNDDSIWQPASCASKPTYLIGGRYIFIDDGKTKATDKYNSYVAFDMVSQKYRYFGGDNFTDEQGQKEHILSVQNENDTVVFYIDHADTSGPLAGSSSFKHSASYANKYITRRVIDLSNMHFQDYKIAYQIPKGISYYFIDAGSSFSTGQIATLTTDTQTDDGFYAGTVANDQITFAYTTYQNVIQQSEPASDETAKAKLDTLLSNTMPTFTASFNSAAAYSKYKFDTFPVGKAGDLQYLIARQSYNPDGTVYDNPTIYNSTDNSADVMTNKPVLNADAGGNYVSLGVF